jgi:tRNA dimethylallyltransferase
MPGPVQNPNSGGIKRGMEQRPGMIVIAGPTASGKTSLSVKLALELNGEIINADSMQVYRGMDIGTAKPTTEERRGIPHHLMDVVDPDEEFNAAMYRSLARPLVEEISSRGKLCFVVGGTGLYLKSLWGGLSDCPPSDPEIRAGLRREFEEGRGTSMHERLRRADPESGEKIHPNDKVRIIRALEIISILGRPPSEIQREHGFGDKPFRVLKFCLELERGSLYRRIDERSEKMMDQGLIEESENLLDKGYAPDLRPFKALGYKHVFGFLRGGYTLEEAVQGIKTDTRRYAKRQLTWFRKDPEMFWVHPEKIEWIAGRIRSFIR